MAARTDQPLIVPEATSISREEATRSLSAIGSNMRPKFETPDQLRAIHPSSPSEMHAKIKIIKATERRKRSSGKKRQATIAGTATMRPQVKMLGREETTSVMRFECITKNALAYTASYSLIFETDKLLKFFFIKLFSVETID
jgi:hypothetical protein